MKINEDLSILFWLKREKGTKDGRVPIYVRITVKNESRMASPPARKSILILGCQNRAG